jgi:hypothetical protein
MLCPISFSVKHFNPANRVHFGYVIKPKIQAAN